MFKAMDAQKQQHVFPRQAEHRGPYQLDRLKVVPQAFGIEWHRKVAWHDRPV